MTMNPALVKALADAEQALAADARGHLELGPRQAIWAALGPRDAAGRCARAQLAMRATRRVLPIWEHTWPGNRLPHRLLALTEQVCAGTIDGAALAAERNEAVTEIDDVSYLGPDIMAAGVGYAALHALTAAIEDEPFDPDHIDPAVRDEDVQPEDHDSNYLASVAAAGGPPWHEGSSPERRREFWRWWLREAVGS